MKFCIPEIHGQGHDFDVPIDDGAVLKDILAAEQVWHWQLLNSTVLHKSAVAETWPYRFSFVQTKARFGFVEAKY